MRRIHIPYLYQRVKSIELGTYDGILKTNMSQTIEIKSESPTAIVFNIAGTESVIRWTAHTGNFEAIVGGDDDVNSIRDHLMNKDLIEKISEQYRKRWNDILSEIKRKEENLKKHLDAQCALLEELKAEFPDRIITHKFTTKHTYSSFSHAITIVLISVTCKEDNNRGWGLYLPNWMSGVYVGTCGDRNPILFTNTGERLLNICKRHVLAWLDEEVREQISHAHVGKEFESKDHAVEVYREILYANADEKVKKIKEKSINDVLKALVSTWDISSEDMGKYKFTCDSPPF